MMAQSWPGVLRRRVSQPSIHFPRSVYNPSFHSGAPAFSRPSLGAKNSSFAAITAPPRRSLARSMRSVNEDVMVARDHTRELGMGYREWGVTAPYSLFPIPYSLQIGRASCRERV